MELSFRICVRMRHRLASSMTLKFTECSIWQVFIICLVLVHADFAFGHGPDEYQVLPKWAFSKANCSLFRNEMVLRPLFRVWPENIPGVPFQYCCEYQPDVSSFSKFNLSSYAYGNDTGSLQLVPYYNVGLVDEDYAYYLLHWSFWWLLSKQFSSPKIYCDVTDMQMLYSHRWLKTMIRGTYCFLIAFCVLVISILAIICYKVGTRMVCKRSGQNLSFWERLASWNESRKGQRLQTNKMELASDVCHMLLLTLVGNCLMEGIAHSPIRGWKSQLMFNMGITYTYLTLFTFISTIIRHSLSLGCNS